MLPELDPEVAARVRALIRDVPDFPKPGIIFKDLSPVFAHGPTFGAMAEAFAARYRGHPIDAIVAIEARGFVVAAPVAAALGKGLIMMRKPGKLPWQKVTKSYALEYGTDTLEMHADAFERGARLVVIDDVLATGGTMRATVELLREQGAEVVEAAFVVELGFLQGRARLDGLACASLIRY